jgi:hypothetical protein
VLFNKKGETDETTYSESPSKNERSALHHLTGESKFHVGINSGYSATLGTG